MELLGTLKQTEAAFSLSVTRVARLQAKVEDLLQRARKTASAAKTGLKTSDMMFPYDLQIVRREARTFGQEISGLPNLLGGIERGAHYEEAAIKQSQALLRLAERLAHGLRLLSEEALQIHQNATGSESKIEAWYLVQETEEMSQKAQGLPNTAGKIAYAVATPEPEP